MKFLKGNKSERDHAYLKDLFLQLNIDSFIGLNFVDILVKVEYISK